MSSPQKEFSLALFEYQVAHRRHEDAGRSLMSLLNALDRHYGKWTAFGEDLNNIEPYVYCNRAAAAISALFSDPDFELSENGFVLMMNLHRWMAALFAGSSFGHADHVITSLNQAGEAQAHPLRFEGNNFYKFCMMYFPDSNIPLQPDALWSYKPKATAALCLAMLSPRMAVSEQSHAKKEQLLAWLPPKLLELDDLSGLPENIIHDVYMHCSYADLPEKHAIKGSLNYHLRKSLHKKGLSDITSLPPVREKPVMLVVLEWFNSGHSIYRTHSSTLRAARAQFVTHGVALPDTTDEITRGVFDEFTQVNYGSSVAEIVELANKIKPDVIYFPSIGMFPLTILLTNLRLAPLQVMALGHPATTNSAFIDAVLVEEDYLGDPGCFSERVVALPKDCLPYVPPANIKIPEIIWPKPKRDKIHVAVCASIMKINPGFLHACQRIQADSKRMIEFHFLVGFSHGLMHLALEKAVHNYLPDAKVYAQLGYNDYLGVINSCDMFINPFPFGNTNGIVDTVRQGLPGVCLTGPEVHEHIDEGLFNRLDLPAQLVTRSVQEYTDMVIKLIDDTVLRNRIARHIMNINPDNVLFQGHPEQFGPIVLSLYKEKS
ncbi:glycosyltransferase [Cedecea davisae]|uniref:glycosyltransferase n=1 Tax=Cedecea davisae TaxID=158484 RepID=UPI00376EA8FD